MRWKQLKIPDQKIIYNLESIGVFSCLGFGMIQFISNKKKKLLAPKVTHHIAMTKGFSYYLISM